MLCHKKKLILGNNLPKSIFILRGNIFDTYVPGFVLLLSKFPGFIVIIPKYCEKNKQKKLNEKAFSINNRR